MHKASKIAAFGSSRGWTSIPAQELSKTAIF